MPPERSQMVSHYRLLEKVGEGGMGVVWKARDTILSRDVAIKFLPPAASRDPDRKERFLREARLASSLSEAHIVQVHEFGSERGLDFIVMEFVDGRPLSRLLNGRPLDPLKVASTGLQIALGLAKAHRKGLLHRDLKPSNIMVGPDGSVKVVDFGLATLAPRASSTIGSTGTTRSLNTMSGWQDGPGGDRMVAGTPPYMSPEQVRGDRIDARSDIFSLGVILYQMTTGRHPFPAATRPELVEQIRRSRPRPVHEIVTDVPLDLDKIIHKTLAPAPGDRYQSMEDLAVDLRHLRRDLESGSSPSFEDMKKSREGPARSWKPHGWAAGILLLAGLALVGWLNRERILGGPDPGTLLILPLEIQGQGEGAEYAGRALAETMAIFLSEAEGIDILPVPRTDPAGERSAQRIAGESGAGRLLSGTLARDGDEFLVQLKMVDIARNRLLWGVQDTFNQVDLSGLGNRLAREVADRLGVSPPRTYESILILDPDEMLASSPDFVQALGALRRNEIPAALQATSRLVEEFPGESRVRALRSYALFQQYRMVPNADNRGILQESLIALERNDPRHPYREIILGALLMMDGSPRECIRTLTGILGRPDLGPSMRASILALRAQPKINLGESEGAFEDLEESLRLDPANVRNLAILANLLISQGRLEEAVIRARQAVALDPTNWFHHHVLGMTLSFLEEWEESAAHLKTSCKMSRAQESCANYSYVLHRAGRPALAEEEARRAADLTDTAPGNYNLACYWCLVGNRPEALDRLRRAVGLGFYMPGIGEDPDLACLAEEPEFAALVGEVEERSRAEGDASGGE